MTCALLKDIGIHRAYELADLKLRITRADVDEMMYSDEKWKCFSLT